MSCSWKKLSDVFNGRPIYLTDDDLKTCYIAREYISRGGYQASDDTNMIMNFKMGINVSSKRLYYRDMAIKQFADELLELFQTDNFINQTIIVIPSSKIKTDIEYDDRMDKVCAILRNNPNIHIIEPIRRKYSRQSRHTVDTKRDINSEYNELEWICSEWDNNISTVVILDDIITSGASFKACQNLILQHYPNINIFGVFWAVTVNNYGFSTI